MSCIRLSSLLRSVVHTVMRTVNTIHSEMVCVVLKMHWNMSNFYLNRSFCSKESPLQIQIHNKIRITTLMLFRFLIAINSQSKLKCLKLEQNQRYFRQTFLINFTHRYENVMCVTWKRLAALMNKIDELFQILNEFNYFEQ